MLQVLQSGFKVEPDLHTLTTIDFNDNTTVLGYVTAECRLELRSISPDLYIANYLRIW